MKHDISNIVSNLAILLHGDQKRRIGNEHYSAHLREVAKLVTNFDGSETQIYAAWLHDVVEDTGINRYWLKWYLAVFNIEPVYFIVEELTDKYTKEDYPNLNRAERKLLEKARLSKISDEAKFVKLADCISNLSFLDKAEGDFKFIYLEEQYEKIKVLQIDDKIWHSACEQFNLTAKRMDSPLRL